MAKIAPKSDKFMKSLNYKSGLRILLWPIEVLFFLVLKMGTFGKSDHFWTTNDFYFMNLSLLGAILAIFRF